MATKIKSYPVQSGHTAGIFADMTVDGPDIGTLVAVVDRAKNLPNRKTIGKQDPYCAARLGKEARKTATDIRGGQTPKWDQELRFPVHDSPDYYQLKISIFTDDKRTDLIGEAWIDLKAIVVPGGGQNDVWQTLTCRGKYAGEIRLEITYYDTRPKPEKPAARPKQPTPTEPEAGSTRQRSPAKRRPLPSDPVTGEAAPIPVSPIHAAPAADHQQTPPRNHHKSSSHSGFIPNQSPLQSVEYNTPPGTRPIYPDHYSPSPRSQNYSTPPRVEGPRSARGQRESFDNPTRQYDERAAPSPYDHYSDPQGREPQIPPPDRSFTVSPMEDTPPPPPAHRSRHNSPGYQEAASRQSFDVSPTKSSLGMPMRHDVLKSEAHRNSAPSYPGRPTYRAYESRPSAVSNPVAPIGPPGTTYDPSFPRHQSFDEIHEAQLRSLQPTVEDVPDSPTGMYSQGGRRVSRHDELAYDSASRSPNASPHYINQPTRHYDSQDVYGHHEEDYNSSRQTSHMPAGQQSAHRSDIDNGRAPRSASYAPPSLPPSLSPGIDPALSQELSNRIYEERRHDPRYNDQPATTSSRGRQRSEPPSSYVESFGNSPQEFAQRSYDRRPGMTYSGRQEPQNRQSVSPGLSSSQQHTIRRKSVSPAPPSATENRRKSDVPFGPDSYDAYNPSMVSSRDATATAENRDPSAKIIAHDGREIDPSDHLPMESWAPEPEPKTNHKQASSEPRSRPSPSGAQPMPPSGRRPLRVARASAPAISTAPPSYAHMEEPRTPPAPGSAGRNRLQKKTPRGSAGHSPAASSPLAPISPDNYQDRQSPYTPTRGAANGRGSWDYANENHMPYYGGGPPIPAKIPLPAMSGAIGGEHALMEEMSRIDIGAGRSRRRGGY